MSQSQPDRGSLWLDRPEIAADAPLPEDGSYDDIVVGAGLTGLVVALLLARAGRRVGVVEARRVGAVTTGHTTAKASLLQGTKLSRLLRLQSRDVAAAYVEANREGQAWLLRFCADHDVAHQRRDAVTFAAATDELPAARAEHDAAASLGLPVRWTRDLDVPFPLEGATVLADQVQFDPMDVVEALVAELGRHGGAVHEGHRVIGVSKLGSPVVRLADGHELRASNVVLATGTPVLDRGLYFAKLEPQRSYILAFDSVTPPESMFLSAGQPVVSVREVPRNGSSLLLVGGSGHVVGRARSEQEHVTELRDWTARYFPGARETHSWSAQDYSPADGIPYVGRMPRGTGHIFVATGFDKWGMTNAVAAGLSITSEIFGQLPSWAVPLRHRLPGARGAARAVGLNIGVVEAALRSLPRVPSTLAASDEVLPVCTHLGGCLHWNDAEGTWDCPLHGSRFAADGEVLEGPATRRLRPRG